MQGAFLNNCTRVHSSIRCQEVKLTIIYHICCSTHGTKIIKDLTCRNIAVNEEMHRKSKILVIHFTTPFCGNYNWAFFLNNIFIKDLIEWLFHGLILSSLPKSTHRWFHDPVCLCHQYPKYGLLQNTAFQSKDALLDPGVYFEIGI